MSIAINTTCVPAIAFTRNRVSPCETRKIRAPLPSIGHAIIGGCGNLSSDLRRIARANGDGGMKTDCRQGSLINALEECNRAMFWSLVRPDRILPPMLREKGPGGIRIFSTYAPGPGAAAVSVCKTCTFSYKISYNPAWQKEAVNRGRNWLFNRSNRLLSGRL
jgi:hypothetical protein